MGGAYSSYGGEKRRIQGSGWDTCVKETTGVDGRIILRWIFKKWDVGLWTGSSWLRMGTAGGHL
jgi:hypothetical protein